MKKPRKPHKLLRQAKRDFKKLKKEVRDVDRQVKKIEDKYEDYV